MLESRDGRQTVRHYMFDFGSIMGSGTVHAQTPRAGNEYILEWAPGLRTGLSLGFYFKPWTLIRYPDAPRAVGRFEGQAFRAEAWRPEYPNTAFDNMRPEDAFWAARIVSRFDEAAIRAIVAKARYSDPRAADYITRVLIQRRDKVLRRWLTAVNPLVDPTMSETELVASNAAVVAGVATAPERYTAQWFTLDNATGATTSIGAAVEADGASADGRVSIRVPAGVDGDYLGVAIEGVHREYPAWRDQPATFVFRRSASGRQHVGTQRYREPVTGTK
jgi:hypothetical protein